MANIEYSVEAVKKAVIQATERIQEKLAWKIRNSADPLEVLHAVESVLDDPSIGE